MSEPREWPNTDPAYSDQYWSPPYQPPPTQPIPPYWQPPPPPPPPPKSPRWLWIAAGAAVVVVAALVVALVVVSNSSRETTVVAPPTAPTSPAGAPRPTLPPLPIPLPTAPEDPGGLPGPGPETGTPANPEAVVYRVTGEGRAINITYVDTDGVMQTEFNVALPWSKEVTLAAPAKNSASVAVVNVGRDVTCSVSVNGTQVRQRSGRGLTICSGIG